MLHQPPAHLCTVEVHEAEREELQADGEAVQQPEGEGSESVGRHTVPEVEREEEGSQGGPQQTQEQEGRLVAEALVSVPQDQPELHVDEDEEEGVEDGVGYSQAQSDVRRHGWAQGRQRQKLVHRRWLLLRHRGRHGRLSLPGGGERSGGERRGLTAGLSQHSHPGRGEVRAAAKREGNWADNGAVKKRAKGRAGGEKTANFLLPSRRQAEREAHDQR